MRFRDMPVWTYYVFENFTHEKHPYFKIPPLMAPTPLGRMRQTNTVLLIRNSEMLMWADPNDDTGNPAPLPPGVLDKVLETVMQIGDNRKLVAWVFS